MFSYAMRQFQGLSPGNLHSQVLLKASTFYWIVSVLIIVKQEYCLHSLKNRNTICNSDQGTDSLTQVYQEL